MARVSKKVSAARQEAENAQHRVWKAAIYARLSDFDDVLRDTESLEVQISYIKEYIDHRDDLMLLDVFADKRCTGINFDRPEFERLLKALQERKVNCIVVKDFSRLGRNFVETGQYLEQVFPLFGVRFIAINDNYDSLNSQSRDGMLVPIKSVINEMYSKDLSQKIQSCFRSKEARGEIYMPVPFGYKRNQQNHLILDEEVSDVVVRIFLWKKSGMKEREIAKKLSAQGIQTPFTRRCQLGYLKNTLRVKNPAWQTVFVTKVLENPIYTGTMVYNRIAYDETNRKIGQNPRESWRMVPDSHPAIISWELFDEISALREAEQAVKEERKKWCRQRRKNNPNIFKGRIFCKKCGEKLVCHVGAKFIMPVPCKHRVLRAPLEQQVRIEDSHAAIVTPEEFEQAQKVIMLQHGKHQAGNYTKHQYPLKGKVYCGYCQKLMKYRVLKKLGPSFNCRFSATAADSPCKRIPISEKVLEEIIRNALTAQIKQAEYVLEILHERERKALICFSALERQEEKLSAEKAEIVKQRVALYEQYADGNMSKEEFIRQRDAYRVQEDEKMEQIQRLRTEKNQAFQPVKRDTDHLQTVMSTVEEAGDVMYLSQNVVETFIDRIEVFNDEHVKIHFTFENVLADYAE